MHLVWELDIEVLGRAGAPDFPGLAVQARRGERCVHLTWGGGTGC